MKNLAPGARCRVFIENDACIAEEVESYDELHARIVYDLAATPDSQAWRIEQQLRAAVAKRRRR